SVIESAAMKLDVFLCDLQAATRLIKQCQALINQKLEQTNDKNSVQLIASSDHEIHLALEETSQFQHLCEVCENAEMYESASADLAVAPRSQLLDKMAMLNDLQPRLFALDQKQQLLVGNQMTRLLLSRLKTWDSINALLEGRMRMDDLPDEERITRVEFDAFF